MADEKRLFARLLNNVVVEYIQEVDNIEDEWHPDFLANCVDITNTDPKPEMGWVKSGNKFGPPPPPVYTLQDQMMMAVNAGVTITSTQSPHLNAKYYANGNYWEQMKSEALYIATFNGFSGGLTKMSWPTMDGNDVEFTNTTQFKNVVKAIGDWRTAWQMYARGNNPEPPPATINLSVPAK